jgi:hypothetical protein
MSTKTKIHRAWCSTCRGFTDHRKTRGGADSSAKLECTTCRER